MNFAITDARYAKGQKLIRCESPDGFKTRAHRLVEALRGRYTNREHGYVVSPSKAKRFEALFREGWDGGIMTPHLIPPGESR